MYKGTNEKPENGQLCICRCPNWSEEGYQIAQWDGKKFDYSCSPNSFFDEHVIAWMPLDDGGKPLKT